MGDHYRAGAKKIEKAIGRLRKTMILFLIPLIDSEKLAQVVVDRNIDHHAA